MSAVSAAEVFERNGARATVESAGARNGPWAGAPEREVTYSAVGPYRKCLSGPSTPKATRSVRGKSVELARPSCPLALTLVARSPSVRPRTAGKSPRRGRSAIAIRCSSDASAGIVEVALDDRCLRVDAAFLSPPPHPAPAATSAPRTAKDTMARRRTGRILDYDFCRR